ncbi:MAG: hypothetical protein Q9226_006516 [Calogaya cf. arnoldii]
MDLIEKLNEAADRAAGRAEGCSICHDTLGTPEGDPPSRTSRASSTEGVSQLPKVTLECGHTFHEHCLSEWLSPILYPSTEHGLDPVATVLEDRSIIIDLISQLPQNSRVRKTLELRAKAGYDDVDGFFGIALDDALDPDDSDNEIEEGEIQEGPKTDDDAVQRMFLATTDRDRFTQTLYPINPFNEDRFPRRRRVFVSDVRGTQPPPATCPYCRQDARLGELNNDADTVQLIRVRFRLANLAYQCLNFSRTLQEEKDQNNIAKFLHRRYEDNNVLAIEDVDEWTLTDRGEHLFKQARLTLREEVFQYMKQNTLTNAEQLRIMQLATFYENFKLKFRDQGFFFGTCSMLDERWDYDPTGEEYRYLNVNPDGYWQDMEIFLHDQEPIEDVPPSIWIRNMDYYNLTMFE